MIITYELVMAKARDKSLLRGYISFIASNQSYQSKDNYFNWGESYFYADLRDFKALTNSKTANEFFTVIIIILNAHMTLNCYPI
ncbi:Uncharacterised protein [Moraxella lacunata]|uniref:Uncharacterized protein n=1 Tax=Moraxella lacunata TaxID=477 RepID=A0A378TUG8_MORLA|nr:hypothetical protein [Moraxella lacunata]STZ64377.1 Uncharacterised protein [Moraxella lacunata]